MVVKFPGKLSSEEIKKKTNGSKDATDGIALM
jgi:hypothetical protein